MSRTRKWDNTNRKDIEEIWKLNSTLLQREIDAYPCKIIFRLNLHYLVFLINKKKIVIRKRHTKIITFLILGFSSFILQKNTKEYFIAFIQFNTSCKKYFSSFLSIKENLLTLICIIIYIYIDILLLSRTIALYIKVISTFFS